MTTTYGKVRAVEPHLAPPDYAGRPVHDDNGTDWSLCCGDFIPNEVIPEGNRNELGRGYHCDREPHPASEVHASHGWTGVTVWGGE